MGISLPECGGVFFSHPDNGGGACENQPLQPLVHAGELEAIPLAPSNAVERRAARAVNPYLFESQSPDTRQSHYNIAMKILERLKSGGATAQQAVAKSGESLA
jgi:hypothetical protein